MDIINNTIRFLYRVVFFITHFWMCIHPEKYIPEKTVYCYKHTSQGCYKPCKFHKHTVIFPKYAGREDLCMYNGSDCIGDDCKTCGINEDFDDEIEAEIGLTEL